MRISAKVINVAVIVIFAAALVAVVLLRDHRAGKPLLPDRAPQDIDQNATIADDNSDKLDAPAAGGASSLGYAKEVVIDLTAGMASLYFENGSASVQDASIFLVVQDTVILQSGLLPPGSTLTSLPLPPEGIPLQPGGYDGQILVQFYDDTGTPMTVNTALQGISIEVK